MTGLSNTFLTALDRALAPSSPCPPTSGHRRTGAAYLGGTSLAGLAAAGRVSELLPGVLATASGVRLASRTRCHRRLLMWAASVGAARPGSLMPGPAAGGG